MEAVEGLAASVARHLCHVLWYLVLLRAAFRQPIGCLATAAFIVIGIGAVESLVLRSPTDALGEKVAKAPMGLKSPCSPPP